MVPDAPKRICPRDPVLIALVGLPDSRGRRTFVRVVILAADSGAKVAVVTGYFMERKRDHWVLVEKTIDIIVE